jgi:hypothetical protein
MTNSLSCRNRSGREGESVATVLSQAGDVVRSFSFDMNEEGYKSFNDVIPKEANLAFEATGHGVPKHSGHSEIWVTERHRTVAHPTGTSVDNQIEKEERRSGQA